MLPSGLPVTVLEESDDGYSRIMTAEGTEGWMLSRYLTVDPSAREQLETLRVAHERVSTAQVRNSTVALHRQMRPGSNSRLRIGDLQSQIGMLRKELNDVRRTAARPMELTRENAALQKQLDQQQREIHQLRFDNKLLKDQSKRNWFLAGTGVTLGSLFLGLVIPRIPWRKRRGWSEL